MKTSIPRLMTFQMILHKMFNNGIPDDKFQMIFQTMISELLMTMMMIIVIMIMMMIDIVMIMLIMMIIFVSIITVIDR